MSGVKNLVMADNKGLSPLTNEKLAEEGTENQSSVAEQKEIKK